MRKTTRHKYYARTNSVQALKAAANHLREIAKLLTRLSKEAITPEQQVKVAQELGTAGGHLVMAKSEAARGNLGRKRFLKHLEREIAHLDALAVEGANIPVTSDEKVLAKVKRHKE